MIRSLWQYRHFIFSSIINEIRARFSRSKLGAVWMIINPLAQVLIYALILSNVLAAKLTGIESKYAYSIFLMTGLLGWTLFNEIVSRSLTLFIEQGNLLKKISFPRITLPAVVIGSCLLNNLLLFITMMGIFALLGHEFTLAIFWLIPVTLILVALSIGIGLILGVMNVFLRDVGQVVQIILQMWFWFTPIVYPASIIPEEHHHLLNLNPMYGVIDCYRQILLYGQSPSMDIFLTIGTASVVLMFFSLFLFRRASAEMVDVL